MIDLLGMSNLTNGMRGGGSVGFGRISLKELIEINKAKSVEVRHAALLVTINKLFRSDMTCLGLYEATRGIWIVGQNRERVEVVMAVYKGIVREVYQPLYWHKAGTLEYATREFTRKDLKGRWEFEGERDNDIRDEYVGFSVGKGGQNPVRYMNI